MLGWQPACSNSSTKTMRNQSNILLLLVVMSTSLSSQEVPTGPPPALVEQVMGERDKAKEDQVAQHKPLRAWDLRQFGYLSDVRDYSTACFLSEDLLLVAINQALFIDPHPLFEETPDAILVLLDMRNEKALRTTHMALFKFDDSVLPSLEGHFLVLTLSEVKLCSSDFHCDRTFPTKGPLRLSSDHIKVVVGGNLMTPRVVLDSRTLAPVAGEDSAKIPTEWQRDFRPGGSFVDSISSVNGARMMRVETRQTRWSKIIDPLAGLGDRPYNRRIIRVYDKQTRKELFSLQWDPRHDWGGLTREPAFSPTGHRVALLRRGVVEVFDLP
jgi:hypothetical protein